jgi:hypothetical protein
MTAVVRYSLGVHWPHEADESLAPLLNQVTATGQTPESGR